jgi:molybdopterin molybdotransferase
MRRSLQPPSAARSELRAERDRLYDRQQAVDERLSAIGGRVLAEPVIADAPIPAHDRATMDGFAYDPTDSLPLPIAAEAVYPEDEPPDGTPGVAVPVSTGAPLPDHATAVLKREDATVAEDRLVNAASDALDPGTNVSPRGSEVARGERVFEAGDRLAGRHAALLRDMQRERVTVRDRFEVAILATGSEIHEGVQPDRDSEMLADLVRSCGHEPVIAGSVPDVHEQVRDTVEELADGHDVVLTTGGTGAGDKDGVIDALDDLGTVLFEGVALRPGRPVAAARFSDSGTVVVALPGKPVAAYVAAVLVARSLFAGPLRPLPKVRTTLCRPLEVPGDDVTFAVPVTMTERGAVPLGHAESSLSVFDDRFRPGRIASSSRATRADALWLTETGAAAAEEISVVPMEVFR